LEYERKTKITTFLKEFKKIGSGRKGIYLIPREESLKALADLGLTKKNFKEILMSLSFMDYCEGPKRDESRPGEIWVFGKKISGKEIYIKLKVTEGRRKRIAKCISFHPAVFTLRYPFQPKERKEKS
jgi:hypothetical protein